MSENKTNRRGFLSKLGLVIGAAAISNSALAKVADHPDEVIQLTPEQADFAKIYEPWLKEFHSVTKIQKKDPSNVVNNRKMVALAEEAQGWQKKLHGFMNDENFVRFHKVMTEKITDII